MKHVGLILVVMGIFAFVATSCDSDEKKNARVQVWLTDAPGDFQEVNIDVEGVEVHVGDGDDDAGWKSLSVRGGVYNLLALTNGLDTLLGEISIPPGEISQIRLKLGSDNTLKVGDKVFDLDVPSGQQSGLKLQVHQTLVEDITYKILLDFDVARSVLLTGSGQYKLKPVIRTIPEAQDGAIRGVVSPVASTPAVYAIQETDTLATAYTDATGHFLLRGLVAGMYTVSFVPNSGFESTQKENVSVEIGQVTDLGTVEIIPH
ncbi:DUF4382 domain-containing protein [Dawidia soli]|uniref:DUF4382 domain-containing protein n=1 Tax=Dawidia soli TaxID=2782352 RepID=A0AAP2D5M8_9BACT|nr:DUF4382 domain-containing protein [Dawidia soli]MBT1685828.1 DUF4382 domain-containing protein [Dawidia soli]